MNLGSLRKVVNGIRGGKRGQQIELLEIEEWVSPEVFFGAREVDATCVIRRWVDTPENWGWREGSPWRVRVRYTVQEVAAHQTMAFAIDRLIGEIEREARRNGFGRPVFRIGTKRARCCQPRR